MKKYLSGLIAIVFAVALSAFNSINQRSSVTLTSQSFIFVGDPTLIQDIENP